MIFHQDKKFLFIDQEELLEQGDQEKQFLL
jgi:hypothetical protein